MGFCVLGGFSLFQGNEQVTIMETCPKCGYQRYPNNMECPRCGVVYKKHESYIYRKQAEERDVRKKDIREKAKVEIKKRKQKEAFKKIANTIIQHKKAIYISGLIILIIVIGQEKSKQNHDARVTP